MNTTISKANCCVHLQSTVSIPHIDLPKQSFCKTIYMYSTIRGLDFHQGGITVCKICIRTSLPQNNNNPMLSVGGMGSAGTQHVLLVKTRNR